MDVWMIIMTLTFYRNKQTVCDSFPFQQLITMPDFSQCAENFGKIRTMFIL